MISRFTPPLMVHYPITASLATAPGKKSTVTSMMFPEQRSCLTKQINIKTN